MSDLPRVFRKVQKLNRIAIPERIMDKVGLKEGDGIMIAAYKGKIIVEPLARLIKTPEERYK